MGTVKSIIILVVLCLFGCHSTTKKPILAKDVAKYKVGQTTMAEVIAIYGSPEHEVKKDGYTVLCHSYISGYIISEDHILRTEFDEYGTLYQKNFDDSLAKAECGRAVAEQRAANRDLKCYNDADCDNGLSCQAGLCLQANTSAVARCIRGKFGGKECANSGASCQNDADC